MKKRQKNKILKYYGNYLSDEVFKEIEAAIYSLEQKQSSEIKELKKEIKKKMKNNILFLF